MNTSALHTVANWAIKLAATLSLLTLAGCYETQSQFISAADADNDPIVRALDKTPLTQVTHEKLATEVSECRGGKICVEICHRPPGDPGNSKTMTLPIAAQLAHLNHGNDAHEHDYLGPCDAIDQAPAPVEPPATEPPPEEEVLPGDSTEPLPPWCADFLSIDSNCDGYIDESGEPLF